MKDWKQGLREIAEEVIETIDHDEKYAWGNSDDAGVLFDFPTTMSKIVIINGEKHILTGLFYLNGELPSSLKYAETNSQFEIPSFDKAIYQMMLEDEQCSDLQSR